MENKNPFELTKQKSTDELELEISQILSAMNANARIKSIINNVPIKYRLQYARSLSSPTKRALAVKMKCYECVGFENVSDKVGNCTCRLCPLWLHRPFQGKETEDEKNLDI